MKQLSLADGAVASYCWSTLTLNMGALHPITTARLIEMNTTLGEDTLKILDDPLLKKSRDFLRPIGKFSKPACWRSTDEAQADIAFRHEVAHMQQDFTTGVGMWDEWHLRTKMIGGMHLLFHSDKTDAHGVSIYRRTIRKEQAKYIFPRPESDERSSCKNRHELLCANGVIPRSTPECHLATSSVLEADAITEVVIHVMSMLQNEGSTASHMAFADDLRPLWYPHDMPEEYAGWNSYWLDYLLDGYDFNLDHVFFGVAVRVHEIFQLILDISLAYPPPQYVAGLPEDQVIWLDPSVKLACLVKAYIEVDEGELELLRTWDRRHESSAAIEEMLLAKSRRFFSYPAAREVYRLWNEFFDDYQSEDGDLFLVNRKLVCSRRARGDYALRRDLLSSQLTRGTDVWWHSKKRLPTRAFVSSGIFTDSKAYDQMQEVILRRIENIELLGHLLSGHAFVCPNAGCGCPSEEAACSTGLDSLKNLPARGCRIRGGGRYILDE